MRTCSIFFVLLLLCGASTAQVIPEVLSQTSGELLTVQVHGVPSTIEMATCDLGSSLPGLPLQRGENGSWSGTFAVLPGMVSGGILRPTVRLYDASYREQPLSSGGETSVHLEASRFDQGGLAQVLTDRNALFVFDKRVPGDSIQLLTRYGPTAPQLTGNTFILPFGVAPLNVQAITAVSSDGATLVFQPDWLDANVATTEEEMQP